MSDVLKWLQNMANEEWEYEDGDYALEAIKFFNSLRADLAAVTEERDAAERSAYEDAARFIEENVFNYSSTENNYWSKRKGGDSNGLEYAREFREKAAAIRSGK